jgi:hypothetical protein
MSATRTLQSAVSKVSDAPLGDSLSPPPAAGTVNGHFVYDAVRKGWVIDETYRQANGMARVIFVGVPPELLSFINSLIEGSWRDFLVANGSTSAERIQSRDQDGQLLFEEDGTML